MLPVGVTGGDSGLGVCYTAVIHESVDFVDGVAGVTVVLVFASTAGGAAPFERPYEADFLSVHLGGLDVMAVGHLGDTSEASTAEALDEARISIGVEHARASSGVTRVLAVLARLWGTRTLGSRKVAVPGGWHGRECSHSRGADRICDVHKIGQRGVLPAMRALMYMK